MSKQFQEVVREFAGKRSRYRGFKSDTVKNLLFGSETKPSSFWLQTEDIHSATTFDRHEIKIYTASVREAVKDYLSTKDSAIKLFRSLTEYVEKEMNCTIPITYPPIPVSNTFERLMYIAKFFHDEERTVDELPNILWVGERTIESDLAKLRGMDGDPLQICGKEFVIDDMHRSMGSMSFASTVHPFFLTCNLTQVMAMLKGLELLAGQPEWRGYVKPLSGQIWQQLSEYGKNRIKTVLTELMPDDAKLIENLDMELQKSFQTESYCTSLGDNAIFESMKGGRPCVVEYKTDNGSEFLEGVEVKQWNNDTYTVMINGQEKILERDKIIRSAMHKERMFS